MTGTAYTEAAEFYEIYKLDVTVIPTNKHVIRINYDDRIYRTKREKYNAVINEIEEMISNGRPVLVGTVTVDVSETLSRMLKRRGIVAAPHSVLFSNEETGPAISRYHQKMPEKVIEAKPGVVFHVNDTRIVATEAKHTDPDAVGFRFETPEVGDIGYTSDTEYFEEVGKVLEKSTV